MAIFNLFNKKVIETSEHDFDKELVAVAEANGPSAAIEASMQKALSYANFEAFETGAEQGNYFGTEFDIRSTAARIKSLYSREPWIYTTATIIARTLASIPMRVYRKGTEIAEPDHFLQKLVNAGNKYQDNMTLNWSGYLDLGLGGNMFLVMDEGYRELTQSQIELTSLELPQKYGDNPTLCIWDTTKGNINTRVDYRYFIQIKLPNPFNPFYGMSPFAAAARPILLDRYKNEFEMAFYLRGATHRGVVKCTEDISRKRMQRFMSTYEQSYTGKRNWFRTLFLPKGAEWTSTSFSMADMQHLEGLRENRLTILGVMGIPPSKVGIMEDANRSNSEEQDKTFYTNTIVPYSKFIAAGWNNSYLVKTLLQGVYEIRPDFSGIESLDGSIIKKGEQSKAMQPFFYIDEIRKNVWKVGPLPNGDGQKIAGKVESPLSGLGLTIHSPAEQAPPAPAAEPAAPPEPETPVAEGKAWEKTLAIAAQNKLEEKLGASFKRGLDGYLSAHLEQAKAALEKRIDVKLYLLSKREERKAFYWKNVGDVLIKAMDRGFSFAEGATKSFAARTKANVDQQAIDVLREKTAEGKRKVLEDRRLQIFSGFDDTVTENIMVLIERGMENGQKIDDIARSIHDMYGENYENQSRTITRTETLSAVSMGQKWHQEILNEVYSHVQKQWLSQEDEFVRPSHQDFDALGVVESDYQFAPGLSYPREFGADPAEVINCFPAETKIEALDVQRGFQRFYSGPMVTVNFKSGNKLSGTPNHPVLTPEGWVPLGKLDKGKRVFKCGGIERNVVFCSKAKNIKSSIGEAFKLSNKPGDVVRIPGSVKDFHGDGMRENVDIVSMEGVLRYRVNSVRDQKIHKLSFAKPDLTAGLALGDGRQSLAPSRVTGSHGGIGTSDLGSSSGQIVSLPFEQFGSAAPALNDSSGMQSIDYNGTGNIKHPTDLENGKLLVNVELDDVISVDVRVAKCHVYNLQTNSGWYIAQGFVVHNCRCTCVDVIPDDAISNASAILDREL